MENFNQFHNYVWYVSEQIYVIHQKYNEIIVTLTKKFSAQMNVKIRWRRHQELLSISYLKNKNSLNYYPSTWKIKKKKFVFHLKASTIQAAKMQNLDISDLWIRHAQYGSKRCMALRVVLKKYQPLSHH